MADDQAVALPIPAVTAGQHVVVMGAAGRVGGYAVQMARSRGAHVIATVSGDAGEARHLGAEQVYDSQATDVIDALGAADPDGADAVLDLVSGPDAIRRDAGVIRPAGRLVSTIFAADEGWFAQRQITARNHASRTNPLISPERLTTVAQMLADGTIIARTRSTADLDAAGQVPDQLRRGGLRGKAVIRLQNPGAPAPHDPSGPAHPMDCRRRPAARWASTGPAGTGPRAGSAASPPHPLAGHERVRTQSKTQQPAWPR